MGSNDLHRFWECEMDVGHAVNIQRIHLESCMRHSSCYDKTLANTSGLRSKNYGFEESQFFLRSRAMSNMYMYAYMYIFRMWHIPNPDPVTVYTVHPPRIRECGGGVTPPPRTVCAPGWRSPQNRGFRKNPKNPVFGGQTGYLNNR